MPKPTMILRMGTEVDVIQSTDLIRGLVVGITYTQTPTYVIQPHGTRNLNERLDYVKPGSIRLIEEPLKLPEAPTTVISIPRLVKAD